MKSGGAVTVTVEQPSAMRFSSTKTESADRLILCAYIFDEQYAKSPLDEDLFTNKFRSELSQFITAKLMLGKAIEKDKLKDFAGEENLEELIKIMAAFDEVDPPARERFFKDCMKILLSNSIKIRINDIKVQFEQETDREKRTELAKELNELTIKLTKLK